MSCRQLPAFEEPTTVTTTSIPPSGGTCVGGTCCGNGVCDANESCGSCPQDCSTASGADCSRVGILYSVWHLPAYYAAQRALLAQGTVLTVEDVIESRVISGTAPIGGPFSLADIVANANLAATAQNFLYQYQPLDGMYCIYQHRNPGSLHYNASHEGAYGAITDVPDCPNVAPTLQRHANQLIAAGVDFVAVDLMNFSAYDATADAMALRPFEVLLNDWATLRSKNIRTPDVAAWIALPAVNATASAEGPLYPKVLDIYRDPAMAPLLLRDRLSGKKVLFYDDRSDADQSLLPILRADGGRNDIVVVPMGSGQHGSWATTAPCQQGTLLNDDPCAQPTTPDSPVGSVVTVSPSYQAVDTSQGYQEGWAGLPFGASGVLRGLTLRKQFDQVFAQQPNYVMITAWNEQIAQPMAPTMTPVNLPPASPILSMGLETDHNAVGISFFDTYGVEFARDVEPSAHYNNLVYDVLQACLQVFRNGATRCNDPNNLCCQGGKVSDRYIWYTGQGGTFGMYAASTTMTADLQPLYVCSGGASPLLSNDATCDMGTMGHLMGYVSNTKGGETLRTLLRCTQSDTNGKSFGNHGYSLTGTCNYGLQSTFLGYVR